MLCITCVLLAIWESRQKWLCFLIQGYFRRAESLKLALKSGKNHNFTRDLSYSNCIDDYKESYKKKNELKTLTEALILASEIGMDIGYNYLSILARVRIYLCIILSNYVTVCRIHVCIYTYILYYIQVNWSLFHTSVCRYLNLYGQSFFPISYPIPSIGLPTTPSYPI